jgi:hypothetical protein
VFSLWSDPRLYTEVHRACRGIIREGLLFDRIIRQRALLNTEIMEIGIIENADLESSFVRSLVFESSKKNWGIDGN